MNLGNRFAIMLFVVFACALVGCQQGGGVGVRGLSASDPTLVDRLLIGEVMMNSELKQNLRTLCMTGGRLSGSENGHKAERIVETKVRSYGLATHLEPFKMLSWQDRSTTVTVLGETPYELAESISLGNCLSTPPEGVTGELVGMDKGTKDDFKAIGDKLRGKIGIVYEGGLHRSAKMRLALEHGAIGLIQISSLDDRARVGNCHSAPRPEPGVVVIGKLGKKLMKQLEAGEKLRVNIKIDADCWDATPNNVVAEIPGSGPFADEVVLVGAHLDSWHLGEGGLDNGTGSVAILEAARSLAALDWQPQRTVRFVWFMGEEHGLYGSQAYVDQHREELDNIVVMINLDMPGSPRSFATFKHKEVVTFLKKIVGDLAGYAISDKISIASWTASDHAPFMKQGVCALTISGDMGEGVKYYHSAGDKYEEVDIRATTESAAVLAVMVRRFADIEKCPTSRLPPSVEK